MKITLSDIGQFFKNSLAAILKGEFLLRLNIGKYFLHIVFTFFLFAMVILLSILTETSMAKVERNKRAIQELEIVNSQKVYELARMSRRHSVIEQLKALQSPVTQADKPATILKK